MFTEIEIGETDSQIPATRPAVFKTLGTTQAAKELLQKVYPELKPEPKLYRKLVKLYSDVSVDEGDEKGIPDEKKNKRKKIC